MSFKRAILAAAMAITANMGTGALAEDLTIGVKSEISSADPHVLWTANRGIGAQVFEPLFKIDSNQRTHPGLVESWSVIEPTLYEFKLRDGIKFHDGSQLSADDVKYSIERASTLEAPRTFKPYLRSVAEVTIVDPLTFRVRTKAPTAILVADLSTFGIVSKAASTAKKSDDFNGGSAAVGTGPYKWIKWSPGDKLELVAFDDYWGGKPDYDNVTYKFIKNDSTRVSSLLSGDLDVIDVVPPTLMKRLESDDKVHVISSTSNLLNYLGLDQHRDVSPYITGMNDEEIPNPFKDVRVRKAMSLMINRELIADRIMEGLSTPSGQFMAEGMVGYIDGMDAAKYDPAKAKELLKEAGYSDGFKMTIHCTNDRYLNDGKVCEALGQLFSANGIPTKVQTLPRSVFFKRASKGGANGEPEFSLFMVGFGPSNGVADAALLSLAMTHDSKRGTGAYNRSRYSNAEYDSAVTAATASVDDEVKRQVLLEKATRLAIDEVAIIPLHHLNASWAARKGIAVTPRLDGFTPVEHIKSSQ